MPQNFIFFSIILVKLEMLWLSKILRMTYKILRMTYNLGWREYLSTRMLLFDRAHSRGATHTPHLPSPDRPITPIFTHARARANEEDGGGLGARRGGRFHYKKSAINKECLRWLFIWWQLLMTKLCFCYKHHHHIHCMGFVIIKYERKTRSSLARSARGWLGSLW